MPPEQGEPQAYELDLNDNLSKKVKQLLDDRRSKAGLRKNASAFGRSRGSFLNMLCLLAESTSMSEFPSSSSNESSSPTGTSMDDGSSPITDGEAGVNKDNQENSRLSPSMRPTRRGRRKPKIPTKSSSSTTEANVQVDPVAPDDDEPISF